MNDSMLSLVIEIPNSPTNHSEEENASRCLARRISLLSLDESFDLFFASTTTTVTTSSDILEGNLSHNHHHYKNHTITTTDDDDDDDDDDDNHHHHHHKHHQTREGSSTTGWTESLTWSQSPPPHGHVGFLPTTIDRAPLQPCRRGSVQSRLTPENTSLSSLLSLSTYRLLGPDHHHSTSRYYPNDQSPKQDDCRVNVHAAAAAAGVRTAKSSSLSSASLPKTDRHQDSSEERVPTQPLVSQEKHEEDHRIKKDAFTLDVGKLDHQHDDDHAAAEDDSTTLAFDSRPFVPRKRVPVLALAVHQQQASRAVALDPLELHPSHQGERDRALRTTTPWSSRRSSAVSSLSEFDPASGSDDENEDDKNEDDDDDEDEIEEQDFTRKRQSFHDIVVMDSMATDSISHSNHQHQKKTDHHYGDSVSDSVVSSQGPLAVTTTRTLVVDAQPPVRPSRRATATTTTTTTTSLANEPSCARDHNNNSSSSSSSNSSSSS